MKDRIVQRGYFCIEVRDAFTNQPITSEAVRILVNGQIPISRKESRYHIFNRMDEDLLKVKVESLAYEEKSCVISVSPFPREIQILPDGILYPFCGILLFSIVLYPGEHYRLPAGYSRTKISGHPGEEIRVIKNQQKCYYLAQEYQGGQWIGIYMKEENEIRGRYFRIQGKEGMPYEDFVIIEEKEGFGYRMTEALKGNYAKGSRVYELYSKMADKEGMAEVILADKI